MNDDHNVGAFTLYIWAFLIEAIGRAEKIETDHSDPCSNNIKVTTYIWRTFAGNGRDLRVALEAYLARAEYQVCIMCLTVPGWPLRNFGRGDERSSAVDLLLACSRYTDLSRICAALLANYPITGASAAAQAAFEQQRMPLRFHLASACLMLGEDERAIGVLVEAAAKARRWEMPMAAAQAMAVAARLLGWRRLKQHTSAQW